MTMSMSWHNNNALVANALVMFITTRLLKYSFMKVYLLIKRWPE